jgi:Double sensory domain of two-component sensor kinase
VEGPEGRKAKHGHVSRTTASRWYTSSWVHLLLGVVVAVLAVAWAGQRATDGVRNNLDVRLQTAGASADAALVTLEAEQLSALRAITFTQGIGQAVATNDAATLNRLVTPLQANSDVPMVDVVRPNGLVVLAVRSKGAPAPVARRTGLPALAQAIHQGNASRGGERFTEVVIFRSGPTILTIGPVLLGTKAVGAVLVMTPLADALGRLSQEVGADLTAYDTDGVPIATTVPFRPKAVGRNTARALIGGAAIEMRYIHGDHREALGRLIVDHQADAVLGISLVDNSSATGRAVMTYAGLGLIGAVLILATFWARVANRRQR